MKGDMRLQGHLTVLPLAALAFASAAMGDRPMFPPGSGPPLGGSEGLSLLIEEPSLSLMGPSPPPPPQFQRDELDLKGPNRNFPPPSSSSCSVF